MDIFNLWHFYTDGAHFRDLALGPTNPEAGPVYFS